MAATSVESSLGKPPSDFLVGQLRIPLPGVTTRTNTSPEQSHRNLTELFITSFSAHQAHRFRGQPQLFPLAADIRSALAGNWFAGSIPLPGVQWGREVRVAKTHRPVRQHRQKQYHHG